MTTQLRNAQSTKRCIKTAHLPRHLDGLLYVRKHRAPNGALRLDTLEVLDPLLSEQSESTERQTVH